MKASPNFIGWTSFLETTSLEGSFEDMLFVHAVWAHFP